MNAEQAKEALLHKIEYEADSNFYEIHPKTFDEFKQELGPELIKLAFSYYERCYELTREKYHNKKGK